MVSASTELSSKQSAIKAVVDGLDLQRCVAGWACVLHEPAQRVKVSVRSGENLVASGLADLPRPDVGAAGYGDGNSGYSFRIPESMFDGDVHRFSVSCEAPAAEPLTMDFELELPIQSRALAAMTSQAGQAAILIPLLLAADADGGPAAVYAPGQYVICTKPYPSPVYHVRGWHEPEEKFTWICGISGTIEMLIPRPNDAYRLMLDVVPNGIGPRRQALEVFFNCFRVGYFEVPAPRTLPIELPAELFILRNSRIDLFCEHAVCGTDLGLRDSRRLGIAVRSWCIS